MVGNSKNGFVLSVILHGAVAGAVAFVSVVKPPQKPQATIFELVAGGLPPPPGDGFEGGGEEDSGIDFKMPRVRTPRPTPRRQTPPPQPAPPSAVSKSTAKAKQPATKAAPAPKQLSYEEFVRQHGTPKAGKSSPKAGGARGAKANVPRIDTRFGTNLSDALVNPEGLGGMSTAEQTALGRYLGLMYATLRDAWDQPPGLAHTTAAVVEFDVAADGRFSNIRIAKSSGNVEFDESVLDAFRSVVSVGPPPDGRPKQFRLTFRLADE